MWTIEDFKNALEKADLQCRPYLIICHPDVKGKLLEIYPNLENEYMVETCEWIESEKVLMIKRTEIEKWKLGEV